MVGATDNERMWDGLRITQSRHDRQIKRLNFSQIEMHHLQFLCWRTGGNISQINKWDKSWESSNTAKERELKTEIKETYNVWEERQCFQPSCVFIYAQSLAMEFLEIKLQE